MTVLFSSFNLPEQMNKALVRMNYETATPIQAQAIPFAMEGRDVLGSAQTGTGKTAAFSIPMIAKLMADPKAMALVLAPTRELAAQTLDVVHKLTSNNRDIRTALLIGGEPMGKQFAQLRDQPRVVIGTPGRINDHLRRNPNLLSDVIFVAVDEADRMLDMGFSEQIDEILATLPKERQTLMFSATFPDSIIKFSRNYLNNPQRVSVSPEAISAPKIKHEVKRTTDNNKYIDLLAELEARDGSVIIFAKTQHGTDRLATRLGHDGHSSVAIHGGLRQNQRDRAVSAFRQKRFRIMVATDVASRGLDIPHIEHVINYDLPQVAEDYIHRIGRTARAGAEGNAMAFVSPSDTGKWNAINRLMNPGEAPMRGERGERGDARPNRGGFKSGGFGGYKGRDDRSGSSFGGGRERSNDRSFGNDRPKFDRSKSDRFGNDRSPYDRPKTDRPHGERSFGGDRPRNDRPQGDRPYGGERSFGNDRPRNDRPERNGNSWDRPKQGGERSFNSDRPRNDRPQGDRPHGGERSFDRPRNDSGKPFVKSYQRDGEQRHAPRGEDRKPTDRNWNTKAERPEYRPSERNDRPQGDRPFRQDRDARPQGGERPVFKKDGFKDSRTAGVRSADGFKSEGRDGGKPKSKSAPAAKKPFKFKEHSRGPEGKKRAAF